jgi:hypothetical protein
MNVRDLQFCTLELGVGVEVWKWETLKNYLAIMSYHIFMSSEFSKRRQFQGFVHRKRPVQCAHKLHLSISPRYPIKLSVRY